MKNNQKGNTFIILAGIFILSFFTYIGARSLLPNNSSQKYYSKEIENMQVKITNTTFSDGKIIVTTNDNDCYVCVKPTKSEPKKNALCFKKVDNYTATFSVYEGKTYFIWIKDSQDRISDLIEYNTYQ